MKKTLKVRNLIILIVCAVALCAGIWFISSRSSNTADVNSGTEPKTSDKDQKEDENPSDIDFEDEEVIEIGDDEEQGGF